MGLLEFSVIQAPYTARIIKGQFHMWMQTSQISLNGLICLDFDQMQSGLLSSTQ